MPLPFPTPERHSMNATAFEAGSGVGYPQEVSLRQNPALPSLCQTGLQWFVSQTSGVTAALVATADGFEIASVLHQSLSAEKMAAMTSSILALGEVVLAEAELSDCQNVVIESSNGMVVMLAIGDPRNELLLSVIADRNAMLGQVLWAARRCCEQIRQSVAQIVPH